MSSITSMTHSQTHKRRTINNCIKVTDNIFSLKRYLGRWEIDLSGFLISKGISSFFGATNEYLKSKTNFCCVNKTEDMNGSLTIFYPPDAVCGQDVISFATIPIDKRNKVPEQMLIFVCDGHGSKKFGQQIAKEISIKICEKWQSYMGNCMSDLFKKNKKFIINREKLNQLFSEVDSEIHQISLSSGSTCSIKWLINDPLKESLHCYDITLGDSPSITINTRDSKIYDNTIAQNCDNEEAILQWLNISYSEPNSTPPNIILSRFNCPRGNICHWVKKNNTPTPIKIFDQIQDNNNKWSLEKSQLLKDFFNNIPYVLTSNLTDGGPQGIRDKERFKDDYLAKKYPFYNFGSTIEGRGQNLACFGDKVDKIKDKIHCQPNINYRELDSTCPDILLMGSDGLFDIFQDNIILKLLKDISHKDSNKLLTDILDQCYELAHKYKFLKSNSNNPNNFLGSWDDQSGWCIVINAGNKLKTNKTSTQQSRNQKRNKKRAARKRHRRYKHKN